MLLNHEIAFGDALLMKLKWTRMKVTAMMRRGGGREQNGMPDMVNCDMFER